MGIPIANKAMIYILVQSKVVAIRGMENTPCSGKRVIIISYDMRDVSSYFIMLLDPSTPHKDYHTSRLLSVLAVSDAAATYKSSSSSFQFLLVLLL